jgi:enoyl-CoA hydratase
MSDHKTLRVKRENGVVTVTLARESSRNAIDLAMCVELAQVFDALRFDPGSRVVLVRAKGPAFCAGVDIKELKANGEAWRVQRRHRGLDAYLAIERCPTPVIAVVEAPAYGGGCELAAACDFVVASASATFQWPEALHGGVGATQRLPRIVGPSRARELLFTGRTIDALEAQRIGFATHVVAPEAVEGMVKELVAAIGKADATALRGIKRAMQAGEGCDRSTAVDIERQSIEWAMAQQRNPA